MIRENLLPGSLGPIAKALLELVAQTAGPAVPRSLSGEFSWSASSFARFARQAVTMELRRSLAMSLRGLVPTAAARCILAAAPPQGPPPGPDSMFDVFRDPSGAAVPPVATVRPHVHVHGPARRRCRRSACWRCVRAYPGTGRSVVSGWRTPCAVLASLSHSTACVPSLVSYKALLLKS